MYGIAGYVATAPKIKSGNVPGAPLDNPGNLTRPRIQKLRAQLARANREEERHG